MFVRMRFCVDWLVSVCVCARFAILAYACQWARACKYGGIPFQMRARARQQ